MQRRRFLVAAASAAATARFAGLAGCGGGTTPQTGPVPIPPEDVVLKLPEDMYLHLGAPTEWWWHTGTLHAGSRLFGFEINAASFASRGFAFTQIMLTDVEGGRHYQRMTVFVPPLAFDPSRWAESDPSKDWFAQLGHIENQLTGIEVTNPGSGYTSDPTVVISGGGGSGGAAVAARNPDGTIATILVVNPGSGYTSPPTVTIQGGGGSGATARAFHSYAVMQAPAADPTRNMRVQALLCDDPSFAEIRFDLTLSQQGRPFFVWGTGVNPGGSCCDLENNNYYFSLTRLQAAGTIDLEGEVFEVEGVTWMDHEYGLFGSAQNPVKWILQDMQLDNGFTISNYATLENGLPELNEQSRSTATLQDSAGNIYFVETNFTPIGRTWTSPQSGDTYFLQFRVEIPDFEATIIVTSLFDDQEFSLPTAPIYEGIALAEGEFQGRPVRGTAWIEEDF
jgi:predicted secreted hydrolase